MRKDRAISNSERAGWVDWLQSCRTYLLLVANREIGPDLKSKEGASDLVQEALLQAHRDRGKFVGRTETELRRWLRRILLHKIAHSVRRYRLVERRRVAREISLDSGAFDGDADWLAADQTSPGGAQSGARKRSLWAPRSIGCPSGCARPCSARHHEGCSFDELGRRLGCSNVAARKLWLRLGTAPARAESRDSHVSTGSVDDRENQLAAQAEALDLALAAGEVPTLAQGDADSGEAFSALLAAHATLQFLERVWPRGTPRTAQRAESERDAAPRAFGRFRVIKELGRGGFGVVFLAIDPQLNRPVALKLPLAEALLQSEVRQRFLREARAAGALDHPNVIPLYEAGEVNSICYLASAFCDGPTLSAWLRDRRTPVSAHDAGAWWPTWPTRCGIRTTAASCTAT